MLYKNILMSVFQMTIFNFWVMLSNFDLLQMFYVLNTSSPVLATKISRPQQYAFSVRNTE